MTTLTHLFHRYLALEMIGFQRCSKSENLKIQAKKEGPKKQCIKVKLDLGMLVWKRKDRPSVRILDCVELIYKRVFILSALQFLH